MPTIWARSNDTDSNALGDPELLGIASYLLQYPFHERLYPGRARNDRVRSDAARPSSS